MSKKCDLKRAKFCPMSRSSGTRMLKESFVRTCKGNIAKMSDSRTAIGERSIMGCNECEVAEVIKNGGLVDTVEGVSWIGPMEAMRIVHEHRPEILTKEQLKNIKKAEAFVHRRKQKREENLTEDKAKVGFSDAEVIDLFTRYAESDITIKGLAKEVGKSKSTVGEILSFKTYKHVKIPKDLEMRIKEKKYRKQGGNKKRKVLTEKIVKECRALYKEGVNISKLSVMYDVPRSTLSNAVNRRTWKHISI